MATNGMFSGTLASFEIRQTKRREFILINLEIINFKGLKDLLIGTTYIYTHTLWLFFMTALIYNQL